MFSDLLIHKVLYFSALNIYALFKTTMLIVCFLHLHEVQTTVIITVAQGR